MAQSEWRVSGDAAEVYERLFVPAIFGRWASQVPAAVRIPPADHRVTRAGKIVGLDLDLGMLAVARRIKPEIEWREGDAKELPFNDASDAVVSQFALMYFNDRGTALSE